MQLGLQQQSCGYYHYHYCCAPRNALTACFGGSWSHISRGEHDEDCRAARRRRWTQG